MHRPLGYCLFNYSLFCRIPFNEDNYWTHGMKHGGPRDGGARTLRFVTNVTGIATSEIHAKFLSQRLKVGDILENVG
jgi:hypothetical protein